MSVFKRFFTFLTPAAMLVLAFAINVITHSSIDARDDSALVWSDVCELSELVNDANGLTVICPQGDEAVVLNTYLTRHVVLVANTPIRDRSAIPVECQYFESGRWTCSVDGDEQRKFQLQAAEAELT